MASPHTAGCAALILSASPDLDITSIENLMIDTSVDLGSSGPDYTYGHGRIDCHEAVSAALDTDIPWLSVEPVSGSVDPGDSQNVTVRLNANLALGVYNGNLIISNNDPDENPVTIPVKLEVTESTITPTPTPSSPTPLTPTPTPSPIIPTDTPTPTASPIVSTDTPTPTPEPGVVFFDDFESDRGWVRDPFGSDTATTGLWERGDPQGTSYDGHPMQLDLSFSGSNNLVTGPLAGASVGSHDIDSGVTSIRSPDILLPKGGEISLSFIYYLAHLFNASNEDFLRVTVVGSTTALVLEELGSPDDDDAVWERFDVNLNDFAGQTIYLVIEAADGGDPSLVEAGIDDVAINVSDERTPTPTPSPVVPTDTPTPTSSPIIPTDTPTPTPTPLVPTDTPTPTPGPGVVFFDDFESDRGWVRDPFGSDTATTGLWERGDPQGTSYDGHPMQLDLSVSGSNNLVTGALAGASVGSHDVDSGVTSIRSPDILLPNSGEISLSFSYYLAHLFNASNEDFLRVTVVGSTSTLILEELGSPDDDDALWEGFETSLNDFAGQTIYLVMEAADHGDPSLVEAGIDDVAITIAGGLTPTPTLTPTPIVPTETPTTTPTSTPTSTPTPLVPTETPTPTPELGVVFFDDFESDLGWVRDPFRTDTATTGLWERGDPQGTSYNGHPMQLDLSVSGSNNLATGPLAGASVGVHDVDSGVTSIRSPDILLPNSGEITLSFSYYLAHLFNATNEDFLRVKVVGSTTTLLLEELGSPDDDDALWEGFETSLADFTGQTIYLIIEAADSGDPSLVEAAIDDVLVMAR